MYWNCMLCNIQLMIVVVHDYCILTDYHYVSFEKHSKIIMKKRNGENKGLLRDITVCWLTRVEEDVLVALVLGAGADEELWAHALSLFHFTLAVVVIVQDQAVQLLSWVMADCIKGDVVILLPPWKEKTGTEKKQPFTGLCLICGLRTILPFKSPF